jgi:hypothetical protein
MGSTTVHWGCFLSQLTPRARLLALMYFVLTTLLLVPIMQQAT